MKKDGFAGLLNWTLGKMARGFGDYKTYGIYRIINAPFYWFDSHHPLFLFERRSLFHKGSGVFILKSALCEIKTLLRACVTVEQGKEGQSVARYKWLQIYSK